MIVTVGGTKGGSGKTTVATNLAVMAAAEGRDVLLVDADDQETAADFATLRAQQAPNAPAITCIKLTGRAVHDSLRRMLDKYDDVVIDTGGRDTQSQRSALVLSDIYLVPFVPRGFDVWTVGKVDSLVREIRTVNPELQALAFINRGDPEGQGSENSEAAELLMEADELEFLPDIHLQNLKAFGRAGPRGLSVTELDKRTHNVKASHQTIKLFQRCFNVKSTLEVAS